jgi:hypothetical protein
LSVIAITDHDSVNGVEPALIAAKSFPNVLVIPGVELNTKVPRGEVHILGYFIDYHDHGFQSTLEELRRLRWERGRKMVAKLSQLGVHIDWEQVLELAAGASVGRPHIAQAMLERSYISSQGEAFAKYIGRDGPAYVEREGLTPVEAVALVVRARGLPVLAHPADIEGLSPLIIQLKQSGLVGLEVYYDGYAVDVMSRLDSLAREHNLIPCGGSDYHGFGVGSGSELGSVAVPQESVAQLIALAGQNRSV